MWIQTIEQFDHLALSILNPTLTKFKINLYHHNKTWVTNLLRICPTLRAIDRCKPRTRDIVYNSGFYPRHLVSEVMRSNPYRLPVRSKTKYEPRIEWNYEDMDTIIHFITKMLVNDKQVLHGSSCRNLDQTGLRALRIQLFHRKFLFRVSQVVVSTTR